MRAKKKRVGTKAKIRALKERERRIAEAIFLALILFIAAFSAYFSYTFLTQPQNQTSSNPTSEYRAAARAAIVDQASLSPAGGFIKVFIENASKILKQAGYTVDYYPGEQITVEFYRNLPTHEHKIIILRAHSSAAALEGKEYMEAPVSFFTSENYSRSKYVWEQLADQLVIASYEMPQPPYYFAITPNFVALSMNGNFHGTTIIMEGCEGLNNTKMAEAFIQKGAKVYIGWDRMIFFSHTDAATIHLLQHLLIEKQTISQAVENTMREVGPDPLNNSSLSYFPLEAGKQTIENVNGD